MRCKVEDNIVTQYPYNIAALKADYPDTIWPREIPETLLQEYGSYPIVITEAPTAPEGQKAVQSGVELIDEQYQTTWGLVDKTAEELAQDKARQIAAAKATRRATINAPINGFDVARPEDRENIEGAIDYFDTLSGAGSTITWTMADDTEQDVTLAELQTAKDGYVLRKAQAFATYQAAKAAIG